MNEKVNNIKPDVDHDIDDKVAKRLTRMYIVALTAVALLTITGQVLIQRSISKQLDDSHVVNMAGSQRYMSQSISKLVALVYTDIGDSTYETKIEHLATWKEKWARGHKALLYGDKELDLPGDNSDTVKAMFAELSPYHNNIVRSVDNILMLADKAKNDRELIRDDVLTVLKNEGTFLYLMDRIVFQYDKEALRKVTILRRIELFLMIVTLIILVLEGMFIFRPAALKIKETIRDLVESEKRATALARDLKIANIHAQRSLKGLKDVSFAMDKATILAKTDRYGVITYVNEKFCDIVQYRPEELIGNRFNKLSGHYHGKPFFDQMWETISEGKVWHNEIKNQAKDGSFVWLDATIVPVNDEKGIPESYIAIYTDISSRFKQSINEQKIRSASILEGQEKERKNIARELHDGLGQMLTALKFNFEMIKGSGTTEEQQHLKELKKHLVETIQETRRISFNLMPSVLNDYGLGPAVKYLTDQMSKHSNIKIIFENNFEQKRLQKNVEINLYRIIQEAVNNAVKYAQADELKIEFDQVDIFLRVMIADNGIGFVRGHNGQKRSGNGILNIQERTSLINGDFRIHTAPGEGTRILIKVPLNSN